MQELRAAGLGHLIRSFHGCFVPRFISRDPTSLLSHHSWGIAFDTNLAGNYYGDPPQGPGWWTSSTTGGSCGADCSSSPTGTTSSTDARRSGTERRTADAVALRYWIGAPAGETTYQTSPTPWPFTSPGAASCAK